MKNRATQEKRYFDGKLKGRDFASILHQMKRKRGQKNSKYYAKKIMNGYANLVKYGKGKDEKNPS